jgi:hypothetical protein
MARKSAILKTSVHGAIFDESGSVDVDIRCTSGVGSLRSGFNSWDLSISFSEEMLREWEAILLAVRELLQSMSVKIDVTI